MNENTITSGYKKNSAKLIEYKLKHGCKDCGYNEHHAALEFDHLPGKPKTVKSVTTLLGRGWNCVLKEIQSCDLVCGNCHNIRTWKRRNSLRQ